MLVVVNLSGFFVILVFKVLRIYGVLDFVFILMTEKFSLFIGVYLWILQSFVKFLLNSIQHNELWSNKCIFSNELS